MIDVIFYLFCPISAKREECRYLPLSLVEIRCDLPMYKHPFHFDEGRETDFSFSF